jgi:S-adenosylmethionine/arginine decarboxylase-like enzyme
VHTWPETAAVTLDVYVCNFDGDHSTKAHALMAVLQGMFRPETCTLNQLQRGTP